MSTMSKENSTLDVLLDDTLSSIDVKCASKDAKDSTDDKREHSGGLDDLVEEFRHKASVQDDVLKVSEYDELHSKIDRTIERLLLEMESGALESTDDNEEEMGDFDVLVEQLMSELTSKELLGEPFAALSEIYPQWLEKNRATLSKEDFQMFNRQCEIACEIHKIFEEEEVTKDSSKSSAGKSVFLLMQEMQELGSLPDEVVSSMGKDNAILNVL